MNIMRLFSLQHSKFAYRADLILYGIASVSLASFLTVVGPQDQRLNIIGFALIGLVSWTLIEYVLHRFVLHGLQPFSSWHAEHHRHPTALINTPTILSVLLIAGLVFLPTLIIDGLWHAWALTFGVLTGYFIYSITHHALHHWHANNPWLKQRKHWHALHHSRNSQFGHYGVTSAFWDHLFRSNHDQHHR
ncbi:MAG: sterol desaturase family protein [Sulfuriferula sp.]